MTTTHIKKTMLGFAFSVHNFADSSPTHVLDRCIYTRTHGFLSIVELDKCDVLSLSLSLSRFVTLIPTLMPLVYACMVMLCMHARIGHTRLAGIGL